MPKGGRNLEKVLVVINYCSYVEFLEVALGKSDVFEKPDAGGKSRSVCTMLRRECQGMRATLNKQNTATNGPMKRNICYLAHEYMFLFGGYFVIFFEETTVVFN